MNKLLPLAAALAAVALCSAAQAQSSVTVYGRLYPYLINEKGSSPTAPGTPVSNLAGALSNAIGVTDIKGMQTGNSRFGFRGQEDLGGGLKVFFQLEAQVQPDTGTVGGGGVFFNRDTFLGAGGGFGEIKLGEMDTVFKEYGDTISFMGISSGTPMSSSNILRKPGFGTSNNARFHERRPNSIKYESPEFAGLQFGLQVATSEGVSVTSNPGIGSAKTWSAGLKYDQGPWYFAIAHEIHDNWFGGSSQAPAAQRNTGATDNIQAKDRATQATVEWRIDKGTKIGADFIRKEYKEGAIANGRFRKYTNNAWQVGVDSRLNDQWRVGGHYVSASAGSCERVNAVCSTDGLEGRKLMFGGGYYFSRRTQIWAAYNQVTNGKSARFSASSEFGAPNPGEDFKQFLLGITHGF